MTTTRLLEIELLANANPNTRSAPLLLELVEEVRRLQARNAQRSGFVPPSVDQVAEEFSAMKVFNGSARSKAEEFVAHYQARGWKLARGVKMVDWRSACVTWKKMAESKAAPVLVRQSAEPRL